ncbi:MAG: ABC transporter ATP-binding protein/permease, partial [Clostridiales bacterium]|nr:ABC transporter ATP-binding protein/permease [Clostridiales bacterium]
MKRKREKPESAPKGRNARRVFFYFLKGCKRMLVAAVLVSVVESALAFITPLILQLVMDGVLGDAAYPVWFSWLPGAAVLRAKLPYIALVIVGFTLTNAVVSYIARRLTKRTAEAFGRNIRNRLFAHIQSLPFSWHSDVTTGDIIQRSTADVDLVKRFIDEQLIELLSTVTRVGVGFSLMFMLSTVSGAVGIVVIPLIVGVSLLFFRRVGKLFQVADEADGAVSTALQENLTGLRVVRAFGAQRYEVDRFEQKTGDVVTLWRNLSWRLGLFWGTGDLIAGTQIMALMVSGAYLAAAGSMTLGVLLAVLMIAQMTIWPVRHFGRILGEASKTGISLKRLYEVIAAAPEPKGGLTPVITGDVEFRNVSFAYKDGRKVLDDISFTLKAGQTLGIVGGTGSGKSTLAALLTRLYDPTEGVILLNGVPTTDIDRQYLRANVGIVLQEPFLFSRTVRDNLVIARETAAARMEDM